MSQCDGDRHKLTFRRLKTFSFLITILARFLDVSRAMVFLKRVASAFRGVWGEVSSSPTEKTQTRRSKERKRRSVGVIGGRANKKSERRRSGDRAKLHPPCEVPLTQAFGAAGNGTLLCPSVCQTVEPLERSRRFFTGSSPTKTTILCHAAESIDPPNLCMR